MLNWQPWEGSAEAWDDQLRQFPDFTVFQCHAWGEHKRQFGWQPLRLKVSDGDHVVALAQVLAKRYPLGIGLAWVPGGPLGGTALWGDSFRQAIRSATGVRFLYCRISPMCPHSEEAASQLATQGWRRCAAPFTSALSLVYLAALSEDERLRQCSGNWRHNLRRSSKHGSTVYLWDNPDPEEMMVAYSAMQTHKQLKAQTSREEIVSMFLAFAHRCVLVRCDDAKGNLLALRGALVLGDKGWDTFAVATPAGRKVYASHAAFWELIKQCAARGVKWYDMGGVDPINNRGVYDFKKGTGAQDLHFLGEWEHAAPAILGTLASRAIALRQDA